MKYVNIYPQINVCKYYKTVFLQCFHQCKDLHRWKYWWTVWSWPLTVESFIDPFQSDVYLDQTPLHLWLRASLSFTHTWPDTSVRYFTLHFPRPLARLSFSADQTAAELFQKKRHSEIWCCITMPQTCTYHSTAAALPRWNVIDPATIHARRLLLTL